MTVRNEGITLLRGIAVALVMLRHALPGLFEGAGVVGVVMFFALSGHLITGLLLDDLHQHDRVRFGRFAYRRAVRLAPALLVMVAELVAVSLLFDPLDDAHELGRTVLVALTWTADLPFPHGSDAIFHLWTLAVEEQFYLVWPLVLMIAWRRKRVAVALGVAAAVSVGGCILSLVWAGALPDLVYTFPTSWVLCFVIGAASRVLRDRVRVPTFVAPIALAVLGVLSVLPVRGSAATYLLWAPLIALLTAALVSISWREWSTLRTPALRPLVALGVVSYGAYLWNYPLTLWLRETSPSAPALAAGLTIVAATLSWMLIEKPLARIIRRSPVPVVG